MCMVMKQIIVYVSFLVSFKETLNSKEPKTSSF
jgi:hypothetical protein